MKTKFARKRSQRKPAKRNLVYFFAGIMVLGLLATLYIWQRMETVRLVKGIGGLESKIGELAKTRDYFSTEVARLSSPQEICPRAERILGLGTTDIGRQLALADPGLTPTLTEKWQQLLTDLKQYGRKAWELAEPQAMAKEKSE
jgi:cell division protein FtsL